MYLPAALLSAFLTGQRALRLRVAFAHHTACTPPSCAVPVSKFCPTHTLPLCTLSCFHTYPAAPSFLPAHAFTHFHMPALCLPHYPTTPHRIGHQHLSHMHTSHPARVPPRAISHMHSLCALLPAAPPAPPARTAPRLTAARLPHAWAAAHAAAIAVCLLLAPLAANNAYRARFGWDAQPLYHVTGTSACCAEHRTRAPFNILLLRLTRRPTHVCVPRRCPASPFSRLHAHFGLHFPPHTRPHLRHSRRFGRTRGPSRTRGRAAWRSVLCVVTYAHRKTTVTHAMQQTHRTRLL